MPGTPGVIRVAVADVLSPSSGWKARTGALASRPIDTASAISRMRRTVSGVDQRADWFPKMWCAPLWSRMAGMQAED